MLYLNKKNAGISPKKDYSLEQNYTYDVQGWTNAGRGMDADRTADNLYQIKTASGMFNNTEYTSTSYKGYYDQSFDYDRKGNILKKTSSKRYSKPKGNTSELTYELNYSYYENAPHQETCTTFMTVTGM